MKKLALIAAVSLAVLLGEEAFARVGGGHSYSGSRSSGGSRSSSSHSSSSWHSSGSSYSGSSHSSASGESSPFVFVVLVVVIVVLVAAKKNSKSLLLEDYVSTAQSDVPLRTASIHSPSPVETLKQADPTFSEPLFLEWATLLYCRAQEAQSESALDALRPYLSPEAAAVLLNQATQQAIVDVRGVIVGSVGLVGARSRNGIVEATLLFHANRTVVFDGGREEALYTHERWTLTRAASASSRPPEKVDKLGCPNCGSPVERTALNQCAHCGASTQPGASDWKLIRPVVISREKRPPLLTGDVEEVGTDFPTIRDEKFGGKLGALQQADPGFSTQGFEQEVRRIFLNLQQAWSTVAPEMLRANETDTLFQSHRFWLDEFKRQGLVNKLEEVAIKHVELVKVETDAFYDSITCRIYARMRDYTVKVSTQEVVGGNRRRVRAFSEYWTFIRRRGVKSNASSQAGKCPNCGAPLQINQAGICESCDAKITRGDFSWVLSRITQDEEYSA